MGRGHLAVGVKRTVGIRQNPLGRVAVADLGSFQQIFCFAHLAGPGGDEDRVSQHFGPAVSIGAQLGGTSEPLNGDHKPASANGHLRGPSEQVCDVLIGFGGRRGQVPGVAHEHVLVESGQVAVGIATILRIGLMDDCGTNQRMAKSDLPQGIHHQKPRGDRGFDVAHDMPGPGRGPDAAVDAVECRPQ